MGAPRKTEQDYHDLANRLGWQWMGQELPPSSQTKTLWLCPNNHTIKRSYKLLRDRAGCRACAGTLPLGVEAYHRLASEKGFFWCGDDVKNAHQRTLWRCSNNHEWPASYASIYMGSGCPHCSGKARRVETDYINLGIQQGVTWIGKLPPNTGTPTEWLCGHSLSHRWLASYDNIKFGKRCPHCSNHIPKTEADYIALSRERGITWLGPMVSSSNKKTRWQCKENHIWPASFQVIQRRHGCPHCSNSYPIQSEQYHEMAKKRGFIWVEEPVKNVETKMTWICPNNHYFLASYNNVQQGKGCPQCVDMENGARVSKIQRQLCELLGGELNYEEGNRAIDVAIFQDGIKIAVEYDSWFWHGGHEERDTQRSNELIAKRWRILRVKSNYLLPTSQQLSTAIDLLLNGESYTEITLEDWGIGKTFRR